MNIIKDYEKAGIAIAAAALGLAAYQAHKTKQAVDATEATDPSRNPIWTAIDLSKHTIGTFKDWVTEKVDDATGYAKGKKDDLVTVMQSNPASPLFWMKHGKDLGRDAAEAGTKYVWALGANAAASGKDLVGQLTNKGFTLMGGVPTFVYGASKEVPKNAGALGDALSGVAEKGKTKARDIKNWLGGMRKAL